jgi:hypothetical protein
MMQNRRTGGEKWRVASVIISRDARDIKGCCRRRRSRRSGAETRSLAQDRRQHKKLCHEGIASNTAVLRSVSPPRSEAGMIISHEVRTARSPAMPARCHDSPLEFEGVMTTVWTTIRRQKVLSSTFMKPFNSHGDDALSKSLCDPQNG